MILKRYQGMISYAVTQDGNFCLTKIIRSKRSGEL